ncbi:MAG TPA: tRNA (adenosine(37)-N6)-threonylcarbamoyltransferase complex transferase subunit TsaD [Acidimicrobiales bacterium]|nr:tRNA (adenosine(37)-N6)-threonylcarbamoyltransferase complex transferase subunit TsaD [Acidimicrobiales bacterium]
MSSVARGTRTGDLLLAIESSCDETAVAILRSGTETVASVVASQIDLHRAYGGVVPELASRAHLSLIIPLLEEALNEAGCDRTGRSNDGSDAISAVGATYGPGLIGPLLVGVSAAKSLSLAWDVPFVGVNHLEAHLYAALLEDPEMSFPAVVLLVSGGHTLLVSMQAPGRYSVLGSTVDDAAGEAFDKVARYLGLGFPGGPAIESAAASAGTDDVLAGPLRFTPPMLHDGLDFSFSGLKTAAVQHVDAHPDASSAVVAAAFQASVVEVLVTKTERSADLVSAHSICLAGGVAANGPLREAMVAMGERSGRRVYVPSRAMCTDNAAMVAAAAFYRLHADGPSSLGLGAVPNLAFPTHE